MKTGNLMLQAGAAAFISMAILVTACKKDSNPSSTGTSTASNAGADNMSANGASADNAYDDAFNVAIQTGNDNSLNSLMMHSLGGTETFGTGKTTNGLTGSHYYCANVSLSGRTFPDTLTVDFGTGCTSTDSITRSGAITYIFSDSLSKTGTTISATFNNYTVNGYKLGGTYSITNNSSLSAGIVFTTQVTNGSITFPGDTAYTFSNTKTVTQTSGIASADISSYAFNITGNYSISSSYGESLSANITKALVKEETCRYIVTGTETFTYSKGPISLNGTFDYGDGTCDSLATVTIAGSTSTVTLH